MRASCLCKWRSKVKYPFFFISGTTGPIDPKFCMHMECDQTSILHNKVNLIWVHLGYANEGQRSNIPSFVSQEALVRLSSNFVCIWSVTRQAYYIIRSIWYEAILAMQMKVKGQISPVLYLRNHRSDWTQMLYAYGVWPEKHITSGQVDMRPSWLCKWRSMTS